MGNEDEAALFLAASHVQSTKTPKANLYENCLSCGNVVSGNYCQACGQKVDDMRRSLFALVAETLGGIFSFESRMWRTFGALLFKPGKVAREYADGARMRYSAPIRTYLVVSILFFSFMSLTNTHFLSFDVLPKDNNAQEMSTNNDASNSSSAPIPSSKKNEGNDDKTMNLSVVSSSGETNILSIGGRQVKIKFFTRNKDLHKITDEEIQALTNEINNEMDVKVMYEDVDPKKILNALFTNPKQFNSTFNTWLPRMMFFMVPFAMILGWLFIRGPKALLIDHLILAIYLQSVLFITTLLTLIISQFMSGDRLIKILFLILLVYFSLSLKHMFRRGWVKTIWTTLVGGLLYSTILFITMTIITLAALANIAS